MPIRRQFRLNIDTVAIENVGGKPVATTIPAGETILVRGGPRSDDPRLVDVLWSKRSLVVFYEDIERHGSEVKCAAS